jgi:hypothetical protein
LEKGGFEEKWMSGGAMPLSLKRTVGALSLGGGGAGVALTLAEVGRQEIGTAEFWILAIFAILFGLGIGIGVAVLEGNPRASFAALLYYVAQIPLVFSSSISYQFAAGAYLYVAASPSGISLPMAIGARLRCFVAEEHRFRWDSISLV